MKSAEFKNYVSMMGNMQKLASSHLYFNAMKSRLESEPDLNTETAKAILNSKDISSSVGFLAADFQMFWATNFNNLHSIDFTNAMRAVMKNQSSEDIAFSQDMQNFVASQNFEKLIASAEYQNIIESNSQNFQNALANNQDFTMFHSQDLTNMLSSQDFTNMLCASPDLTNMLCSQDFTNMLGSQDFTNMLCSQDFTNMFCSKDFQNAIYSQSLNYGLSQDFQMWHSFDDYMGNIEVDNAY